MTTLSNYLTTLSLSPSLSDGIIAIANACADIRTLTDKGALAGIYGQADNVNVQGEDQQKLDVLSNDILVETLSQSGQFAAVASEEMDTFLPCPAHSQSTNADYLCLFDPLDGSGNIDLNLPIGTIFSVLAKQNDEVREADFLQSGDKQLVAGYALYGASTILVLTFGDSVVKDAHVVMFSFDATQNAFILVEPSLKLPEDKALYSINQSNTRYWHKPMQRYITECLAGKSGVRERDFNMRWLGCMVADCHKALLKGGIFSYPAETKNPEKPAKLRLMYEVNPMSLIIENAGGLATTGTERILTIPPSELHQRVPVILGDKSEIERIERYHTEAH